MPEENLDRKTFNLDRLFDFVYLIIFLGSVGYLVYAALNFENYSTEEVISKLHYFLPIFVFSLVGIVTVRSPRSLIYALVSVVITLILMVFYFEGVAPLL